MSSTDDELLLRISKAQARIHTAWDEAINLEDHFGVPLSDLRKRVVIERMDFAEVLLATALRQSRTRPRMNRSCISRAYYAMYHAMRAVVFYVEGGDDHQEHKTLPAHIPADFPNAAGRQNELKDARERRNSADYDPYPTMEHSVLLVAQGVLSVANDFVEECRRYLDSKGCKT